MSDSARRGFIPIRSQVGGTGALRTRLYETTANLLAPLGVGDPVSFISGVIQRWTTAAASAFVGVVTAVYNTDKRPLTHNLPTRAAYLNTSTAGWVQVCDDPHAVYVVECATSIGLSNIGQSVDVNVSSLNSATGISRAHIANATAAGATTPDSFRIIGLAPSEIAVTAAGSPNNDIEVTPILHIFTK